ncbi:hypothetical protein BsWGS_12537 [Bradybaena similaris]
MSAHKAITLRRNITWNSSTAFVMLCDENSLICGQQKMSSFIMITQLPSPLVQTLMAKDDIPVVCQVSYSPDIAACRDSWLFPKVKNIMKGTDLSHELGLCC